MELTIIGAGELGSRVGRIWKSLAPKAKVIAETSTAVRHGTLTQLKLSPRLRSHRDESLTSRILFAVPPSSQKNYYDEVVEALKVWDRRGPFVLISSTAVYPEGNGDWMNEYSITGTGERASRLLSAEKVVTDYGGSVIRMAGLYSLNRGPHRSYEHERESRSNAKGFLNLIHYEDAAQIAVRALSQLPGKNIYLGCDGTPLTREDLVKWSNQYLRTNIKIKFLGKETNLGKRCDAKITRQALSWEPKVPSFEWFCINRPNID